MRRLALVLVIIGLLGITLRFLDLRSNPPSWLSASAAEFIDEGYKLHTSRNIVLFGAEKWTDLDEYDGGAGSASVFAKSATGVFRVFGVRLLPMRLLAAALGLLSVLVLGFALGSAFGREWGLTGGGIFAVDFVHTMFSRLALLEAPQVFCVTLVVAGLVARIPRPLRITLIVLGVVLGYAVKPSAVLWLIASVPAVALIAAERILKPTSPEQRRRLLGGILLVMLVTGVLVYLAVWLAPPALGERAWYNQTVAGPLTLAADNLLSPLARLDPIVVGAGLAASSFLFLRTLVQSSPHGWTLLASWGLFGHLLLALARYNPLRYHLFLIPVFIAASVAAAALICEQRERFNRHAWPPWLFGPLLVLLAYAGASAAGGIVDLAARDLRVGTHPGLTALSSLIVGLLIAAIAWAAILRWRRSHSARHGVDRPHLIRRLAIGFAGAMLVVSLVEFGFWWTNRSLSLARAAQQVITALPHDAIVAGSWAPALCFESGLRTLYVGENRNESSLPLIRPTHFLSVNTDEGKHLLERLQGDVYPGLNGMVPLLRAPIDHRWEVVLYRLKWEVAAPPGAFD